MKHFRNAGSAAGFSLIELMVVVVVIGVLASIAYPVYQNYTMEARRSSAYSALHDAASRQEQFFLTNRTYTATVGAGGLNADTTSDGGYYAISVDAATGTCAIAQCYVLRAAPQGTQAADTCGALTFTSGGDRAPAGCW